MPQKNDFLRSGTDINKSTGAHDFTIEFMHADVTVLVDFSKTQITNIQTTTVIKIKLGRHIQNGAGIHVRAKGDPL